MPDVTLQLLIGALTAVPFIMLYWLARFAARRRLAGALRPARPWQPVTLESWVERGWLEPELAEALPAQLSPVVVFYEWAWADPDAAESWRFREPLTATTPFEAVVRDAWLRLPDAARERARERLAGAVRDAGTWWGGAERGWNGRPLSVLEAAVSRKQKALPLLPVPDLTAAPLPGPVRAEKVAAEADGPDLVLALAALRRSAPRFTHPLAPRANAAASMIEGLSTRVATDLGRRVGAGLGAALGPIGSMIGQYVGEMVGGMGGRALAQQTLPERITAVLQETETALVKLGELAFSDDFRRAARLPADAVLETGKRVELAREKRSRALRERIWPTAGLGMAEEVLRVALAELNGYRAAADYFVEVARKSPEAVAGGMILQNPWMVRALPGGVERLNAARGALNRAALVLKRG